MGKGSHCDEESSGQSPADYEGAIHRILREVISRQRSVP